MSPKKLLSTCSLLCALGALVGTSWAESTVADMREGMRPAVSEGAPASPISGQQHQASFLERLSNDPRITMPHPPIDQIPYMPMPEPPAPGVQMPGGESTMMSHDAITGETRELPFNLSPQALEGAQSIEGDYTGFGNLIDTDIETGRSFGTMSMAGSLDSWPRSGNVKLIMRFTDVNGIQRWFACSGSMQDAGVVLTAAHCVYARSPNGIVINDWADIVYVYPGWDGDSNNGPFGAPDGSEVIDNFGYAYGTSLLAGSNYINNGDWDADCGLVRLTRGSSRNVGMLTGWYAWAWGGSCGSIQSRTYNNFSYPAENCPTPGLHNGRDMYYWSGSVDACPNNQMQLNTGGGNCLDTVWGGMSGSGMYYIDGDNRYVHAVCSTSNRTTRGYYCRLWETFVNDMVDYENATRGNTFDLEALKFRAGGSTTVLQGHALDAGASVLMANATNYNPGSRSFTLRVYLSSNNNISSADTLLATWNYNYDFAAMQTVTFNVPAPVIPLDTPPGTYWIGVELDPGTDAFPSNNDTDTWDAQRITVNEAFADLDADLCDAAAGTYQQGDIISVIHRTYNIGDRPANDVHLEFRASTNNIISTADRLMEERNYGTLNVGGSIYVNSFVRIPNDLAPGRYYIGTRVDTSNNELTYANNWVSDTGTITVIAAPNCNADINGDGQLNFFDVSAFLSAFSNMTPVGDFNGDGQWNFFDISAFLSAFSAGCP